MAIKTNQQIYICDREDSNISDGQSLVEIEGKLSAKKTILIPVKDVMVPGDIFSFACYINDIKPIVKVYIIVSEA